MTMKMEGPTTAISARVEPTRPCTFLEEIAMPIARAHGNHYLKTKCHGEFLPVYRFFSTHSIEHRPFLFLSDVMNP